MASRTVVTCDVCNQEIHVDEGPYIFLSGLTTVRGQRDDGKAFVGDSVKDRDLCSVVCLNAYFGNVVNAASVVMYVAPTND